MRLEDRIRATLRAEAERFEPQLASTQLRPATGTRPWIAFVGVAAVMAVIVGTGVLLSRPQPPADTLPPPSSSQPPQTSTTVHNLPEQFTPWAPEYNVDGGVASLPLTFIDGSTVEISWPADLDLMSDGVSPNGYAFMPEAARDFFIRHGNVEDVVNQFGPATVLDSYSDGRGGTVSLWRPEGAGTDYLGFQFDDWAVLVYEGGTDVGTPPMGEATRQQWIESFRGEATSDGFLRLYGDEPLRIAGVGARLSMTMRSPGGTVELAIEKCDPSDPSSPFSEFMTWCDESGWVTVFVSGTPDFMDAVEEGLEIGTVVPAGVSGPDANGSFGYLTEELQRSALTWATALELAKLRAGSEPAYRLTLTGIMSLITIDAVVEVSDGVATMEDGGRWITVDPPTVETLFQLIENALKPGNSVEVLFDPTGYPERVRWSTRLVGDWMDLNVQLEWLD